MKKILIALLIIFCGALGAGVFWVYSTSDRTGPEIRFAEDKNEVYTLGTPKSALLEGVSAIDAKDGDVSDTLTVESIFARNEEQVVVIYVAKDNSNNVSKAEFDMKTSGPTTGVVQEVVSDEEEEGENNADGQTEEGMSDGSEETGEEAAPGETPEEQVELSPKEAAEAREKAKLDALAPGFPRFALTTYYIEIPRGTSLDRLSFVRDIDDDMDNENELYRRIQVDGDVDIYTPGSYELVYYVVDNDGNMSNRATLTIVVQ